jgi:hypothetical protein
VTTFSTASRARLRRASRDGLGRAPAQALGPPAGLIRRSVPPKAAEVEGTLSLLGGLARRSFERKPASRRRPAHRFPVPAADGTGRSPGGRSCKSWRPSSSRQSSCRRAKITVKCARCAHVLRMALRATLDTDLPRQDPAPIRRTGENRLRQRHRCAAPDPALAYSVPAAEYLRRRRSSRCT